MRTLLTALILIANCAPAAAATEFCAPLDKAVTRAMDGWQVPGLAVGAVQDGQTLVRRTYGVRDVGTGAPVTPRTLFGLGSVTKSVTALAVAIADLEDRLDLDAPVRRLLPVFPAGVTLRHLLSHRAGWPRHDALWYLDAYGRAELAVRLSRLDRFAAPGAAYQYNNVPFAMAGLALEHATGQTWERYVREKVLTPAGMTDAVTSLAAFRNAPGRAQPYFPADEGRIALPLRDTDPVAPAAGLYAHLDDMIRYLNVLALEGGGRVPAAAVREIMTAPSGARYALGLNVRTWNGTPIAFHPGFVDGYGARISILPEFNAGVIVLTNMSGQTPVAQIVSQILNDCLTGETPKDWIAHFGNRRAPPEAKPDPPPPEPLGHTRTVYAGTYAHPAYGAFRLWPTQGADTLSGAFHDRRFELAYAGDDRWRLTETHWPLREGLMFEFADAGPDGFAQLSTPLADGPTYRHNAGPLVFRRTGSP